MSLSATDFWLATGGLAVFIWIVARMIVGTMAGLSEVHETLMQRQNELIEKVADQLADLEFKLSSIGDDVGAIESRVNPQDHDYSE